MPGMDNHAAPQGSKDGRSGLNSTAQEAPKKVLDLFHKSELLCRTGDHLPFMLHFDQTGFMVSSASDVYLE
jgi:hypothetical protein